MKTCKKLFSLLLVAVMLISAIPFASFADGESAGDSVSAVTPVEDDPTPAGDAAPAPASTKSFTVQVRIGPDKDSATNGKSATYSDAASLKTDDVNNETKAFAILDSALPGDYSKADYEFKAASVQGDTIYIRVNKRVVTVTHHYAIKVAGGGIDHPEGHLMICDGTTCNNDGCNATVRVPHGNEKTTLKNQKAATCTTEGYTGDEVYECGYIKPGSVIKKLDHKFTDDKGKCATCAAVKYQVKVTVNGTVENKEFVDETGTAAYNSAAEVMPKIGMDPTKYTAGSSFVNTGYVISFTATPIPTDYTYTALLLNVNGQSDNPKSFSFTKKGGPVDNSDAADILKAANKTYDLSKYEYNVVPNGQTITMTLNSKGTYTVNCITDGKTFASKSGVLYYGTFTSKDAKAILDAAGITVDFSKYLDPVVTVSGSTITVELYNEIEVQVYDNATTFTKVRMKVGYPYKNFLSANLINNSTFGGITVKNRAGQSSYYTASQVNGGVAVVGAFDDIVTFQRNSDRCTLKFLRSDGTVLDTRIVYAGSPIGNMPEYVVGGKSAIWTYNGKPINSSDIYNFKDTTVNIQPYFGGISDVYVDVYTNGNVKTLQTRVKVTDMIQNGVLYLNSEVKSAISSALRNTSNKNLTYTAFFDASTWSDFIKTKNTNGAAEPIRVGDNSEREGSVYLYVMVNNVTQKATDSTNPKTGDDVKLGVAAAVLAVAVVGFGAAIVIKKKKGVQ